MSDVPPNWGYHYDPTSGQYIPRPSGSPTFYEHGLRPPFGGPMPRGLDFFAPTAFYSHTGFEFPLSQTPSPRISTTQTPSSRSEDAVSSPPKRKRHASSARNKDTMEGAGSKEKGKSNMEGQGTRAAHTTSKRWPNQYSEFIIDFLANEVKRGKKVAKSFKKTSFTAAAAAINVAFDESYTPENVANHMRFLKARWIDIVKCKSLSGAGWNEELKMITLEEPTASDYVRAHPKHAPYINKPIPNYDNLFLVVGDDAATGSYQKFMYDNFGELPHSSTPVVNLETGAGEHGGDDVEVLPTHSVGKNSETIGSASRPSTHVKGAKTKQQYRRKKDEEETYVKKLCEGVESIASAMNRKVDAEMLNGLGTAVFELEQYFSMDLLEIAYDRLQADPVQGSRFRDKPVNARKAWMTKFQAQHDVEQGAGEDSDSDA